MPLGKRLRVGEESKATLLRQDKGVLSSDTRLEHRREVRMQRESLGKKEGQGWGQRSPRS